MTHPPLITLTTDFGVQSHYVAQMKGVILGLWRQACLVDLCHQVSPQNIAEAAWLLQHTVGAFPEDSCHLVVVDPGVGTARGLVLARIADQFFIAPDNGLLWPLAQQHRPQWVRQLTAPEYWAPQPSHTFHGRDIMAHVAGHLASGVPPERFGPEINTLEPLAIASARKNQTDCEGSVVYIDAFGNLITNLPGAWLEASLSPAEVVLSRQGVVCPDLVDTYGQRPSGQTVALIGSTGFVEIAVVNGNAAENLQARIGDAVRLRRRPDRSP